MTVERARARRRWLMLAAIGLLTICPSASANKLVGTPASDRLDGGAKADRIDGRGGNDRIRGRGGRDVLHGGSGRDVIRGGGGADRMEGGSGRDRVDGGRGNDWIRGGRGRDRLAGGRGSDRIEARDGIVDEIRCGPGTDHVVADAEDVLLDRRACERVDRPAPTEPGEGPAPSPDEGTARPPSAPEAPDNPCRCTTVVNVRDFGARGDGLSDDRKAIEAAIAALPEHGGRVFLPAGSYRVTQSIRLARDRVELAGEAGSVIVSDPDPALPFGLQGALLVFRDSADGLRPVDRVWVRHLSFRPVGGPVDASVGIVQLNACSECLVEDVDIAWGIQGAKPEDKPRNVDGIALSLGTSGTIRRVLVDGIPKAGIYVAGGVGDMATGSRDVLVEDVEVRNNGAAWTTVDPASNTSYVDRWGGGVSVSAARRVTLRNVHAHGNLNQGLLVGVNGLGPDALPAEDVTVLGGIFERNGSVATEPGEGILVGSAAVAGGHDIKPRRVAIRGAITRNNRGSGVAVTAGTDITIDDHMSTGNGYHGLLVQNTSSPRIAGLTANVAVNGGTFESNSRVVDQGAAIVLHAAEEVRVQGARLRENAAAPASTRLWLLPSTTGHAPSDIDLLDLEVADKLLVDAGAAPSTGRYRITGLGAPNSYRGVGLPAPLQSEYTDWLTGARYLKTTSGADRHGWVVLP